MRLTLNKQEVEKVIKEHYELNQSIKEVIINEYAEKSEEFCIIELEEVKR